MQAHAPTSMEKDHPPHRRPNYTVSYKLSTFLSAFNRHFLMNSQRLSRLLFAFSTWISLQKLHFCLMDNYKLESSNISYPGI